MTIERLVLHYGAGKRELWTRRKKKTQTLFAVVLVFYLLSLSIASVFQNRDASVSIDLIDYGV